MTDTASARGRSNRDRGLQAERDLVRWLRTVGWPHAERAVRTGYRTADRVSADPGDVTSTPGLVWSVKCCAVDRIGTWLDELDEMRARDDDFEPPVGLLVVKRRGHASPGEWWCWLRLTDLLELGNADPRRCSHGRVPVCIELQHVVPLLAMAGYGDGGVG